MKNMNKHFDVAQEIIELTEKEMKDLDSVNILVLGKSGVGKSTLINTIFREKIAATGIGKPVTKHLQKISRKDVPITIYDSRGLELSEEVQKEVHEEVFSLLAKKKSGKDAIHLAYFCIQATSSRIEDAELKLIEEISKKIPVVIVLTQSIGEQVEEFKAYIEAIDTGAVAVHSVLAQPYVISNDYTVEAFGLNELIQDTFNLLPEGLEKSFNNAQRIDIERKVKSAKSWARRYIASSFGVGFVPIPFSDASLLVPMQVALLAHITAIFGIPIDRATLVSIIAAVGGTGSATFLGRSLVSNAFKFIPGLGTVIGGIISGTTASVVTQALAFSYIQVLKKLSEDELINKETKTERIIKLMQKEFKKAIQENKNQLKEEEG
ncbi:MAG: 50S ribosome-binding GTPase, partial [Atopostipes suicloacalis]|nr:50S ribosome-binding GTPase [Atopostipes suicloacalis]